jgi:1,4-alpha-glucan branching enzyme
MKTTELKSNRRGNANHSETKVVHFAYRDANAESVCIAGTFNDWHPCATPMIAHSPGLWIKDLGLAPGDYEYCLIVDGHWQPDPLCEDKIENPFGGMNSVIHIASSQNGKAAKSRLVEV